MNIRSAAAPGTEPAGADGQAPVVGGAKNPQQIAAQRRLQQTQAQVDEVSFHNMLHIECVLIPNHTVRLLGL